MSVRRLRAYYYYLSGRAKYLFVHIPKNAGMTIRHSRELRGRIIIAEKTFLVSSDYTRRLMATMKEGGFPTSGMQHARLRDFSMRARTNLQPFAIIRNPWARVVSRFTFAQNTIASRSDYTPRTLEEFLEERHVWGGREFFWHRAIRGWFPQVDYVTDENGDRPVDILRAEHLDDEATRYFNLKQPLGRRNISNRSGTDYRSFYTPQTIQIVADWYAADIETFGFDFDTPATRNFYFEGNEPAAWKAGA